MSARICKMVLRGAPDSGPGSAASAAGVGLPQPGSACPGPGHPAAVAAVVARAAAGGGPPSEPPHAAAVAAAAGLAAAQAGRHTTQSLMASLGASASMSGATQLTCLRQMLQWHADLCLSW